MFDGGILLSVFKPIGEYFTNRQTIKAAERERKDVIKRRALDAKLETIRAGTSADIEMDVNSRQNAGLMDDVSFYVFLAPLVLCFYPPAVEHIAMGFKTIETMPVWWQYAVGMMLVSVWGYRRLVIPIVEIIVKKYIGK